jgi:DNA-binding response OmpR family regulator
VDKQKILVVDDEKKIAAVLKAYLEQDGFAVITAADGPEALNLARREEPDLIILDLMLPNLSGEEVCHRLRQEGSRIPVIMLTAKTAVEDRVHGLGLGADDYVLKPFSPQELLARVKTILRRGEPEPGLLTDILELLGGRLRIDLPAHSLTWDQQSIALTPTEYNLLVYLARRPGRVFSRTQLAEALFGYDSFSDDRAVDAHVKNLRQKLQAAGVEPVLKTVYGVGYKYDEH